MAKAQQRVSLGHSTPVPSHFLPSSSSSNHVSGYNNSSAQPGPSFSSFPSPAALSLSLPHSSECCPVTHVDSMSLQYLAMEMPSVLKRGAKRAIKRREKGVKDMKEAGLAPEGMNIGSLASGIPKAIGEKGAEVEEETIARLEAIGSHVGANFAERVSRDRPPFTTTLDVLKFICKEIWTIAFDKQVDNLRTNHRGVYVLQDNQFKPLLRLSTRDPRDLLGESKIHVAYPVGIIRGALARLGVPATVVAETSQVPQCTFHVKTTAQRP